MRSGEGGRFGFGDLDGHGMVGTAAGDSGTVASLREMGGGPLGPDQWCYLVVGVAN